MRIEPSHAVTKVFQPHASRPGSFERDANNREDDAQMRRERPFVASILGLGEPGGSHGRQVSSSWKGLD